MVDHLSKIPIFANLAPIDLAQIAKAARVRQYAAGEALLHQNDVSTSVLLLTSGLVKVHVFSESGQESVIALCGPNDVLGELGVIDGAPRTATVTALTATTAIEVTSEALRTALSKSSTAMWALLETVTLRVRSMTDRAVEGETQDLQTRVATRLLTLSTAIGRPADVEELGLVKIVTGANIQNHVISFQMPMTQTDFSALCGGSREEVSRTIRRFKNTGSLAIVGKPSKHYVVNIQAMAVLASKLR